MTDVRDHILDAAQDLILATSKTVQRGAVKRLMAYLWTLLPEHERRAFLTQIEPGDPFGFVRWSPRFPDKDNPGRSRVSADIEEAARLWGYIQPELSRKDAEMGIRIAQRIRRHQTPSATEQRWMRQLMAEWKARRETYKGGEGE